MDLQKLKRLAEEYEALIDSEDEESLIEAREIFEEAASSTNVLALFAGNERLKQFEAAYTEWSDKTDWVQETVHWSELGMHRADVLHKRCRDGAFHQQAQADRIKTLMAEVKTLESQVKALQSDANSYQSGYDAGRAAAKAHADSWRAEAEALRKVRDKLAEDKRGLLEDFGGLL